MAVKRIHRQQLLPISMAEAWRFFSDPANLGDITPPWLHFKICPPLPKTIYAGQIIRYQIKVPPGIPVQWVTEISQVRTPQANEPSSFVDEQRLGPYRFWHHQHHFTAVAGGTHMEDIVHYQLPFAPLGPWIAGRYVAGKLKEIFDYRTQRLAQHFGPT